MTKRTSRAIHTTAALALALFGATSCSVATASNDPTSATAPSECPIDLANGVRCIAERAGPSVVSIRVTHNEPQASSRQRMPFSMPFDTGPRGPQMVRVRVSSFEPMASSSPTPTSSTKPARSPVETSDGVRHLGKVIGVDAKSDVAVVKISSKKPLPFLTLADSETVHPGDFALAMGSPFGLDHSISFGVISAVGRGGMGIVDYEDFIQTDAAINPGNSGGALVNGRGQLIGINTAILSRSGASAGVGFAVPSNVVRQITDQLMDGGKVTRGYLGVTIQDVTGDLRAGLGLTTSKGALVGSVEDKSPADRARLKSGDVVVSMDGHAIDSSRELRLAIARRAPGSSITLGIEREGRNKDVKVTLAESRIPRSRSQRQCEPRKNTGAAGPGAGQYRRRGLGPIPRRRGGQGRDPGLAGE